MTDEQRLLAHAVLDGEATAEELARAQGDPQVQAELTRLRAIRAELADVAPLPDERRAAILAAALDELDATHWAADPRTGPASRVTPPPPVSLAARRRSRWMLPAAAAVLGVLTIGGIASLDGGGGDSDDAADGIETGAPDATFAAEATASGTESATESASDTTTGDETLEAGTAMVASDEIAQLVVIDSPAQLVEFVRNPTSFFATEPADPDVGGGAATTGAPTATSAGRTDATAVVDGPCPPPAGAAVYVGTVQYGPDAEAVDVFADAVGVDATIVVLLGTFDCAESLRTAAG